MKTEYIAVRIQDEALNDLRRLAPPPRHALHPAIKDPAPEPEKRDIKPLTVDLEGFHRLRVSDRSCGVSPQAVFVASRRESFTSPSHQPNSL